MENPSISNTLGYLLAVSAGVLWATSGPMSSALFTQGVPPSSVAVLRPLAGLAVLAMGMALHGGRHFRIPAGSLAPLLLLGGGIVASFQLAYQKSTDALGVPSTVALVYLAPALVFLASPWVVQESWTARKGILAAISVGGVWMAVAGARGEVLNLEGGGLGWGLWTGVGFAAYTLFARRYAARTGAVQALFYSTLGGTVLLTLWLLASGNPIALPPTAAAWWLTVALGGLTLALSPLLYFQALARIEAGRAAIASTVEPVVATLLAVVFLNQGLSPTGWAGLLLLLVGVTGAYGVPPSKGITPSEG